MSSIDLTILLFLIFSLRHELHTYSRASLQPRDTAQCSLQPFRLRRTAKEVPDARTAIECHRIEMYLNLRDHLFGREPDLELVRLQEALDQAIIVAKDEAGSTEIVLDHFLVKALPDIFWVPEVFRIMCCSPPCSIVRVHLRLWIQG